MTLFGCVVGILTFVAMQIGVSGIAYRDCNNHWSVFQWLLCVGLNGLVLLLVLAVIREIIIESRYYR